MTYIAVAIVGTTLVSAYTSYQGSKGISEAAEGAAASSAEVQLASTLAQLNEIAYQYDYTQAALAEGRQLEYNAQNAFGSMLGINGPRTDTPEAQQYRQAAAPGSIDGRPADPGIPNYGAPRDVVRPPPTLEQQAQAGGTGIGAPLALPAPAGDAPPEFITESGYTGTPGRGGKKTYTQVPNPAYAEWEQQQAAQPPQPAPGTGPDGQPLDPNQMVDRSGQLQTFGANIDYQPTVGPQGFIDPMADPTRLAGPSIEEDPFFNYVTSNRIAGETFEEDPYAQRVMGTERVGGNYLSDPYFQSVRDSAITGDTFQESPGYQFALEQGEQALERRNSRGGNYGGRALKESLRYSQGLADQEYYNWADLRGKDLSRQDKAYGGYQNLRGADLSRQDLAYGKWAAARGGDLARSDAAFQNYMGREMFDVNRADRTYQNFMGNLQSASGLGGNINASVQSAQTAGGQAAAAYGNYGNAMTNVYSDLAGGQIASNQMLYGGLNQAAQGGVKNYLTYELLKD